MIGKVTNANISFQRAHICKGIETKEAFNRGYYIQTGFNEGKPYFERQTFPKDYFNEKLEDMNKVSNKLDYDVLVKAKKDSLDISDAITLNGIVQKNGKRTRMRINVRGSRFEEVIDAFHKEVMKAMNKK